MGAIPSLPNISLKFKSDRCNGQDDESRHGEDMVRSRRPSWLRRSIKAGEKVEVGGRQKREMVERSTRVQFKQADEKEISHEVVSNPRDQ